MGWLVTYQCSDCGFRWEKDSYTLPEEIAVACPECGSRDVEML